MKVPLGVDDFSITYGALSRVDVAGSALPTFTVVRLYVDHRAHLDRPRIAMQMQGGTPNGAC
jgi:hypothetical protein